MQTTTTSAALAFRSATVHVLFLLGALLAAVAFPSPVQTQVAAESAVQVVLQVSPPSLLPGDTLVVEVRLLDCPDLSALGPITVQLDAARFSAVTVERGTTIPDWLTTQEKSGRLLITYEDGSAAKNQRIPQGLDVLLCTLRFPVLADAPLGISSFSLVGAGGFVDAFGDPVSSYAADSPPVVLQSPTSPTPEPTATSTPEPAASATPSGDDLTPGASPEATTSPSPTPGAGNATAPSWLWTAWLVTLGVALLEFFLLIGRSGRRSRPSRRR